MMKSHQKGMSLIEVLVSLGILSVIIVASLQVATTVTRTTQNNMQKQFATQRAMSMLEELKGVIQSDQGATATLLDDYDDGTTNRPLLTTQKDVTDPASPQSGNVPLGPGRWLYERRITVRKLPGQSNDLRLVNVTVYINEEGGQRPLADVASVLSTIAVNLPPTQVYDVYCVAIENVPGWWVYMANVVPFVQGAIQDLQSRHPGLQFRTHWIRELAYGRDSQYLPYVNEAQDSTATINSVYFYPGTLPSGSAVDSYYPPDFFNGRINVDGVERNGFDTKNPYPYALADQYNNAMRYPDELALFNLRVASGKERADQPTLRLLLDDMYMHPSKYQNAILINLHGELFPFPPVRNYSDAAKDPLDDPYIRAVTHPEQLHYANTDPLRLRVYGYHMNRSNPAAEPEWLGENRASPEPITLVLKGINWSPTPADVTAITGGVDFNGDGSPDPYSADPTSSSPLPAVAPTGMWFRSYGSGSDTVIELYNTPLQTPCVTAKHSHTLCDEGGLMDTHRLYGLEYIPSPVEDLTGSAAPAPFSTDLTSAGDGEKNTARWVITIPSYVLPQDATITIETRIGSDIGTGILYPVPSKPADLSRTYVWRGDDLWAFGDATHEPHIPITEQYQMLGDPRHNPYADLKLPHEGSGYPNVSRLGMGYNRYFDDFHNGAANRAAWWPGYSYQAPLFSGKWYGVKNNPTDTDPNDDGWDTGAGQIDADVPRIFEVVRTAILRANAVYTTMTGFSYFYVGLGGEIGYDSANNFPSSIAVSEKPFSGKGGWRFEQSITNDTINGNEGGVKYIRENTSGNYWWSMSWLGELYPDSMYGGANGWAATGNLPTGTGSGTFIRVLRKNVTSWLPSGTTLQSSVHRTQEEGSTSFFWSGSPNSTFHHRYQDGTNGTLAADGQDIAANYQFPIPQSIPNARPFDINVNDTGMNPDHFLQPVYGEALTLEKEAEFYRHSTNIQGSSLISMRQPSSGDTAFVVVNGLSPTGQSGVAFMARWSFLSLIQSYLIAGRYPGGSGTDEHRVRELPRVTIASPNDSMELDDPASIDVQWNVQWLRWDGKKYTPGYPAGFAEDTPLQFVTLYSRDNGKTWLYMQDDSPANPGARPSDPAKLVTATSYSWGVPSGSFPKGNYLIRVEAYRGNRTLHYSFHEYRAYIKR
ncbi:MAG: prepilin-type N-terminal cleavage/methylation domain-containing protein [Thermoanaerobaculia bacterium]